MRLAADRDRIARQYVTDYADVFTLGVPRIEASRHSGQSPTWTTTLVFLDFLAAFPDSHIARKFGASLAEGVRAEAERLRGSLPDSENEGFSKLLAFDRSLKERGLNPGSSADLTVASLLASELGDMLAHPAREIG